jgi:hypothetical protein
MDTTQIIQLELVTAVLDMLRELELTAGGKDLLIAVSEGIKFGFVDTEYLVDELSDFGTIADSMGELEFALYMQVQQALDASAIKLM